MHNVQYYSSDSNSTHQVDWRSCATGGRCSLWSSLRNLVVRRRRRLCLIVVLRTVQTTLRKPTAEEGHSRRTQVGFDKKQRRRLRFVLLKGFLPSVQAWVGFQLGWLPTRLRTRLRDLQSREVSCTTHFLISFVIKLVGPSVCFVFRHSFLERHTGSVDFISCTYSQASMNKIFV